MKLADLAYVRVRLGWTQVSSAEYSRFDRRTVERWISRSKVDDLFRVLTQQFGSTKTRYRGLAKNTAQIMTFFVRGNHLPDALGARQSAKHLADRVVSLGKRRSSWCRGRTTNLWA